MAQLGIKQQKCGCCDFVMINLITMYIIWWPWLLHPVATGCMWKYVNMGYTMLYSRTVAKRTHKIFLGHPEVLLLLMHALPVWRGRRYIITDISLELRVPYLQTSRDIHNQYIYIFNTYILYIWEPTFKLMDCIWMIYIYIYVPHHGVIRCSSNRVLEMFGPISQWIFVRWSMFSIFKVWPFPSLAVPVPTPWLNVSPLGLSESWVPQSPLVDNPVQN